MTHMIQYDRNYCSEFEKAIVAQVMKIMDKRTQEMEGYSYYGSNPGMSVDDYEEVAIEIVKSLVR